MDTEEARMTVRLPLDAMQFLENEARADFTSKNAQVVRAIRAAMKNKGPESVPALPSQVTINPA